MLHITDIPANLMVKQSLQAYPNECCGFLLGNESNGVRTILSAVSCRNVSEAPKRAFLISAKEYMQAEQTALEKGMQLLGIYHSHPDCEASPSSTDAKFALPFFSYLICAAGNNEVWDIRSWKLSDSMIFEEEQVIIQQKIFK